MNTILKVLVCLLGVAGIASAEPKAGGGGGGGITVADSAVTSGVESNLIANPQWNVLNPDTVASSILAPCESHRPCKIGVSAAYPTSLDPGGIMEDWETPPGAGDNADFSGYDTYPGAAAASYSSIVSSDDTILNVQLGTSLGCRHCVVGAVASTSGHSYVGPGGHNMIFGENQYAFINSGRENALIGPASPRAQSDNVISGGYLNKIDHAGVTTGGPQKNSIFGGASNVIGHTTTHGCVGCSILGSVGSTITNSAVYDLDGAAILGGKDNSVTSILGEIPAYGASVTGTQGSAWMPYQKVHGGGPGYSAGDTGSGSLQSFELLWRNDIGASDSYQNLNPSRSGDTHLLQYAGVYLLSGQISCQLQTDITSALPAQLEMWDLEGIMMWTGSTATPQFVDASDLTADATFDLPTTFTVGGTNTWLAQIVGSASGGWAVQVTPGADVDELYCQGRMFVTQSRQDTSP